MKIRLIVLMVALAVAAAFLVSQKTESFVGLPAEKKAGQKHKPAAAPLLTDSPAPLAGSLAVPSPSMAAASAPQTSRLLPVTSGQADAQGFEVVAWPGGKPHYEGERVVAQVATGQGGRNLHLEVNQMGEYPRVQVAPQESMKIKLQFQASKPGMPVALTAQDGGTLAGAKLSQRVVLDDQRSVTFDFAASANVGTHRVTIATPAGEVKTLDFWVGEPNTMRSTAQR